MKIKLSWYELAACAGTGIRRRLESIRKGTKDAPGFNREDKWAIDIEGACGEMAAAKALGRYWDASVNTYSRGDVGRYQVRTARTLKNPFLVVRPGNDPADVFILVSGKAPNYDVLGWLRGRDAMKKKYWRKLDPTRPEVYAVPVSALRPLEELK